MLPYDMYDSDNSLVNQIIKDIKKIEHDFAKVDTLLNDLRAYIYSLRQDVLEIGDKHKRSEQRKEKFERFKTVINSKDNNDAIS